MIKFDVSRGLDDFEFAKTGGGKPGEWSVVRSDVGQALAQTSTDTTDNGFPSHSAVRLRDAMSTSQPASCRLRERSTRQAASSSG
jgi:hypothetical protein